MNEPNAPVSATTMPPTTPPPMSEKFQAVASMLAESLDIPVAEVITKILVEPKRIVSKSTDKTAEVLLKADDSAFLKAFGYENGTRPETGPTEAEIRNAVAEMRAKFSPAPVTTVAPPATLDVNAMSILPKPPLTDALLTDALRTGGVSKVGAAHVVALMRAYVAERTDLFGIPTKLEKLVTTRMRELNEPAPVGLRKLRKQLRKRRHSDLLSALLKSDEDASDVTREEQDELLQNAKQILVPKLVSFARLMLEWEQHASESGGLSAASLVAVIGAQANPAAARLAARRTNNINTTLIKNAIAEVNDAINMTYRGVGIEASVALFDEARFCANLLNNDDVFPLVGKTSREEILRALGLDVSATDQQLESDLAQFTMAVMSYPKTAALDYEVSYICEMLALASSILQSKLVNDRPTSSLTSPYNDGRSNDAMAPNGKRGSAARDGFRS